MSRDLHARSPIAIVLGLAATTFLLLGLRTYLMPENAAPYYGVATTAPEAMVFVKAYGARNIAISLMAFLLLVLDQRRALAGLLFLTAGVAGLDALVMFGYSGLSGSAKHLAYVAVLLGLSAATFNSSRMPDTNTDATRRSF